MSTWRGPHHRTRRREGPIGTGSVRGLQTSVRRHKAPAQQLEVTREDFENLVDYYYEPPEASKSHLPYLPVIEEATLPGHEEPKTTTLVEDSVRYGLNEDDHLVLRGFMTALYDESFSHETIFERYNALPSPRIPHLSQDAIRKLLHRLSIIEQKTQSSMVRYLSVVDDVKAAGIPLTSGEWSSAIAFAGRCFVKVSAVEVESALHIWREMEHEAGVKGTHVTFNILFDIAAKAGKFVLAEMILMEMKKRGLRLNRFAHVGLIYYHGLRGDGDGVRKAYRDLVQAGEIVDTLVMNCVIAALARAGEPTAAYQVYERMKRMHAMQSGVELPALDWKGSRELGRLLAHAVAWYKDDPETRQKLQSEQSMAPNLRTYLILVGHYAVRTGELDRVAVLLDEMRFLGVPLHGSILLALLKGFTIHGGVRYTPWSKARLEGVWSSLQRALDRNLDEIFLGKWMVIWILRAFAKCSGKDRMREVWEEIQSRWEPTETDTEAVNKVLHEILGT
ncbi:hypothetical protein MMC16_003838 [Acarospora aff. strigata]|nr:hypothetical protein [Acarospora aff. strigata]